MSHSSQTTQETEAAVKKIIADQLSIAPEKIKDNDSLETLGADSLDRVEIVMRLEEQFGIEINDDEAEKLTTVNEAIQYVTRLRAQK